MWTTSLRILAAMKKVWGVRLTTAFDPMNFATYSLADITIERIGGLINADFSAMSGIFLPPL